MRSSRVKRSRKLRRKAAARLIFLLPMSTVFCVSVITTPSYALMRAQVNVNPGYFSSAFVFPKTVQAMADNVKSNIDSVEVCVQGLKELAKMLTIANSQQRVTALEKIQQLSSKTKTLLEEAVTLVSKIRQLAARAQEEVNKAQTLLTRLDQQSGVDPKEILKAQSELRSAQRVNTYVQSAYLQAKSTIDLNPILGKFLRYKGQDVDIQSTVTQAVYGTTVTDQVYERITSVTEAVYEENVTVDIYDHLDVSQSVYGSEVSHSIYGSAVSETVYRPQTVTQSTYDIFVRPTNNVKDQNREQTISPASQSKSVPQVPPTSASKVTVNTTNSSRTNRKTKDSYDEIVAKKPEI